MYHNLVGSRSLLVVVVPFALLGLQSRSRDNLFGTNYLEFDWFVPKTGTAVLKGLINCFGSKHVRGQHFHVTPLSCLTDRAAAATLP